jgi:hypothetical protein
MFKMELTDSDIELIETDTESESGEDDEPSCLNMVLPIPVRLQASYPIPVPASRDDPRRMKTEVRLHLCWLFLTRLNIPSFPKRPFFSDRINVGRTLSHLSKHSFIFPPRDRFLN